MKILLSIKPEFANKIFDGSKKYEFRKSLFKEKSVTRVVVYASSPIQKVIGEFEIDTIFSLEPQSLWHKTKKYSGISKDFYDSYFQKKDIAHAIKIKNVKKFKEPLSLKKDFKINHPPQSFIYLGKI